MAHKLMHIGFSVGVNSEDVDATISAVGDDWIRLAFNNWLIWTTRSASDWRSILKPYTDAGTYLFVAAIDLHDRDGWLPAWAWNWINSRQPNQTQTASNYILEALKSLPPPQNALAAPPQRNALAALSNLYGKK